MPGHLVVGCDREGCWWAVGDHGSYGGNRQRSVVIKIAIDAKVTGHHWPVRNPRIYVRYRYGGTQCVITRVRGVKASSQFEQDDVP